jgi:hypothetical protein
VPIYSDGVTPRQGPLIPAPQYLTADDADQYFATRLHSELWFDSSPERKQAALVTATRAIDALNFAGRKADRNQPLEFPRCYLTVAVDGAATQDVVEPTPPAIYVACCEEALVRLDGTDPEYEAGALRVTSTAYASVRDTYDRAFTQEAVRAGIMSEVAWGHLLPWLADGQNLTLCRV